MKLAYEYLKEAKKIKAYLLSIFMVLLSTFILSYGYAISLQAIQAKNINQLILAVLVIVSFIFIGPLITYIAEVLQIRVSLDMVTALRINIYAKLLHVSVEDFKARSKEVYLSHLLNDIPILEKRLFHNFYWVCTYGSVVLINSLVVLLFDPLLFVVLMGILVAVFVSMNIFGKKLLVYQNKIVEEQEQNTVLISDFFGGLGEAKQYNAVPSFRANINKGLLSWSKYTEKYLWFVGCEGVMARTIIHCILALLMAYFAYRIASGTSLVIILFLYNQLNTSLMYFIRIPPYLSQMQAAVAVYEKLCGDLKKECNSGEKSFTFEKNIVLENVSVDYNEKNIFHGVNLEIEKNKKYLVVGPSGAGKSTLLKLLSGEVEQFKGTYLIDGSNCSNISKRELLRHIAHVSQDVFLFSTSLYNNITLFSEVDAEKLKKIVDICGLETLRENAGEQDILKLQIEEQGKNLSGGQRQRIALARALVLQPEILLIDEGMAHLDITAAEALEEYILSQQCTVLHISHRILENTARKYDSVIRVDGQSVFVEAVE